MNRHKIIYLFSLIISVFAVAPVYGQHVIGVKGGYGSSTARFYPKQETHSIWGGYTGGITWRYYTAQRYVVAIGAELEFIQRGFSFEPNSLEEGKRYTRHINSLIMPIVWQPHFYIADMRLRAFIDLAVTFSYNMSSTYTNDLSGTGGNYPFKTVRDNRWGYGLAGGGGIAYLAGRLEFNVSARYYFGYSDILRNRNKYMDNASDDSGQNPFASTPLRSPLDNIYITFGVGIRLGKEKEFKSFEPLRQFREQRRLKAIEREFRKAESQDGQQGSTGSTLAPINTQQSK